MLIFQDFIIFIKEIILFAFIWEITELNIVDFSEFTVYLIINTTSLISKLVYHVMKKIKTKQ